MTEPGKQLLWIPFRPILGWFLPWKIQTVAIHDAGLMVYKASSRRFYGWADVEVLTAGEVVSGAISVHVWQVRLTGGIEIKAPRGVASRIPPEAATLIVQRASLEWVRLGHLPMAVRPEVADNLRAAAEELAEE